MIKIGIIGGSGLDNPEIFTEAKDVKVETDFGSPSDILKEGLINGVPCVLLARHGRKHNISPTNVNYRANLLALKQLGCTHVIVSTACGSLRENMMPGDMIIIDQFIDRTSKRPSTFFDGSQETFKGILHMPMDTPFCTRTRNILLKSCQTFNYNVHKSGTMVTVEGPRFSSKAESLLHRMMGGDLVNMTTVPEVVLAKELGLCYAAVAMATDYDCWKDDKEPVSVAAVLETMRCNSKKAVNVITTAVSLISKEDWSGTIEDTNNSVKNNTML